MQPLTACTASDRKTSVKASAVGQSAAACLQADFPLMGSGSRDHLDPALFIPLCCQRQTAVIDPQISGTAVRNSSQVIIIVVDPVECPHGNVAVVGNEKLIRVV